MQTQLQDLLDMPGGGFGASRRDVYLHNASVFGMSEDDIVKSLATSGSVGSDGSSMIGESLDEVVKIVTQDPDAFCPLLERLHTYQASSISEEYNRVTALGLSDGGGWRGEGQLGVSDSPVFAREVRNVKFLGYVGAITNTLISASRAKFGDLKKIQAALLTKKMLLDTEINILWGNSTLNTRSWKGLLEQSDSSRRTNKSATGTAGSRTTYTGGGTLTVANVRAASQDALAYGGMPTMLLCSPTELREFGAEEDQRIRYFLADQESRIAKGMRLHQIVTDFQVIDVVWTQWLLYERGKNVSRPKNPSTASLFHADVPAQLGSGAFSGAAAAGGHLPNDVYYYGIAAVGDAGEGPIRLLSTGYTADNTNGTVDLTITLPPDTSQIRSWRIYRSTINGTDYTKMRFLKEVAIDTAAATQVVQDDGSIIPESRRAMVVNERMASLGFLQKPVMWDLPRIDNTERFAIDAEGVVQLYAPEHCWEWFNLGGNVETPTS